jgi:hypothetical protein
MSIEAMKLALEALEKNYVLINGTERFLGLDQIKDTYYAGCFDVDGINKQTNDAITTLRTAIEQAEKQEPVGEVINDRGEVDYISYLPPAGTPLYTAPRQWVGLTDEEIMEMLDYGQYGGRVPKYARNFVDAIEAKLKEKNT